MSKNKGWVGVDLDGTLAHYERWTGGDIGEPVPAMLARVQAWLFAGQEVRIFTARASDPAQIPVVQAWLDRHGLGHLQITNVKDYAMIELWDDRCVQVEPNTGMPVTPGTSRLPEPTPVPVVAGPVAAPGWRP